MLYDFYIRALNSIQECFSTSGHVTLRKKNCYLRLLKVTHLVISLQLQEEKKKRQQIIHLGTTGQNKGSLSSRDYGIVT